MSPPHKPRGNNLGTIVGINVQFLFATAFGLIAWLAWPSDPHWWGFGVGSVLFGMASLAGIANALRAMKALYQKDKAVAEYLSQGGKPKTVELASEARLRQAGMLE